MKKLRESYETFDSIIDKLDDVMYEMYSIDPLHVDRDQLNDMEDHAKFFSKAVVDLKKKIQMMKGN